MDFQDWCVAKRFGLQLPKASIFVASLNVNNLPQIKIIQCTPSILEMIL